MDNFLFDNAARVVGQDFPMMPHPATAGSLARAAGYLCSAHDELVRAGYAEWVDALSGLLETISMELTWLEDDATQYPS